MDGSTRWLPLLAALCLAAATCLPSPVTAQDRSHHGDRPFYVSLAAGTGPTGLGLLHHDNLVTNEQMGGWTGGLHLVGGLHVDRFAFSIFADYVQGERFYAIPFGLEASYSFLDERLTPTLRIGFGAGILKAIGPAPAPLAFVFQTQIAGGVRWFIDALSPWRPPDDPSYFIFCEGEVGYLHLERLPESDCAPCREGGLDLTRGGSADGLSFRLLLGFGQFW